MPNISVQTEKVRKVGSGIWDRNKKKEKKIEIDDHPTNIKALMVLREHLYKLQMDIYKNSLKDI